MSQSRVKAYKRTVRSTMSKEYRKYIYGHIEKLCREPLKVRLQYTWLVLCKKNPHTGKKVV